eukprot:701470-Rhodomonas_salina.1
MIHLSSPCAWLHIEFPWPARIGAPARRESRNQLLHSALTERKSVRLGQRQPVLLRQRQCR